MSEQPQDGNGASSGREKLRADGGRRDSDEDESETDGPRDDREISPDKDRQDQGQRRGQNQPRQGNQPPRRQQPQRGPKRDDDGVSRRQMIAGGGGVAAAAVGGWFVFLRDSGGGPKGVVRSYISALDSGNTEKVASLIHEEAPSGTADVEQLSNPELINSISVENIEATDSSRGFNSTRASNYETVQEFETFELTTSISGETNIDTAVVAKNADGEWKIWV